MSDFQNSKAMDMLSCEGSCLCPAPCSIQPPAGRPLEVGEEGWVGGPGEKGGGSLQPLWLKPWRAAQSRLWLAAAQRCTHSGWCVLAGGHFFSPDLLTRGQFVFTMSSCKSLSCSYNLTVSDEMIQILAWEAQAADGCHALPG